MNLETDPFGAVFMALGWCDKYKHFVQSDVVILLNCQLNPFGFIQPEVHIHRCCGSCHCMTEELA